MKKNIGIIIKTILCIIGAITLFLLLNSQKEEILSYMKRDEIIHEKLKYVSQENIDVLIMSGNYEGIFHEDVLLSCTGDWEATVAGKTISKDKNEEFQASKYDYPIGTTILITPVDRADKVIIKSIARSQKQPKYRGIIKVSVQEEGYVVINELLLEEYLFAVVPSEMPSKYPMEALKAQAVCARTYASRYFTNPGYEEYGAHVDDSSGYQVYNNIEENSRTTQAVLETSGYVMKSDNRLVDAYYYSTSCGYSTISDIWKTEEKPDNAYLQSSHISFSANEEEDLSEKLTDNDEFKKYISASYENDLEAEESWYRWKYQEDAPDMDMMQKKMEERYEHRSDLILTENLETRTYESKPIVKLGKLKELFVVKRLPGGVIDELLVVAQNATILIIGEYNVRYCLADGSTEVIRQDGSSQIMGSLLPSAFFSIDIKKNKAGYVTSYELTGGGFGHGVGMSQNGAKCAAEQGYMWTDILNLFYNDIQIEVRE